MHGTASGSGAPAEAPRGGATCAAAGADAAWGQSDGDAAVHETYGEGRGASGGATGATCADAQPDTLNRGVANVDVDGGIPGMLWIYYASLVFVETVVTTLKGVF